MGKWAAVLGPILLIAHAYAQQPNAAGPKADVLAQVKPAGGAGQPEETLDQPQQEREAGLKQAKEKALTTQAPSAHPSADPCYINPDLPQCKLLK